VKKLAILFILVLLSCSRTDPPENGDVATAVPSSTEASAQAHTELAVATDGEPFGLRIESGMLTFCDKRGGRKLDLNTGRDTALDRRCPNNDEPNTACRGLRLNVAVRAPLSEPNDIIDFDGWSVPLNGRVHDCAADGKAVAVVTGSIVVLIDVEKEANKVINQQGGDRVAFGSGWVAWSKGSELRMASREALK
jgi:hypothetical protein